MLKMSTERYKKLLNLKSTRESSQLLWGKREGGDKERRMDEIIGYKQIERIQLEREEHRKYWL